MGRSEPFDIASQVPVTMMVARVTGCGPGEFVHTFGDLHRCSNHLDLVDRQLARDPLPLPRLRLRGDRRSLLDRRHHPAIPAPVSV